MCKLVPHILFSADGKSIMEDGYVHRYRRTEGRDWWNAEWRDRTLGLMKWLGGGSDEVMVAMGPGVNATISALPLSFLSPVSYEEPAKKD